MPTKSFRGYKSRSSQAQMRRSDCSTLPASKRYFSCTNASPNSMSATLTASWRPLPGSLQKIRSSCSYSLSIRYRPCRRLSNELGIVVVAGSHVITLNPRAQAVYSDMHLALDGTRDAETGARCAACIVFLPGQAPLAFTKTVRSRSEASLRPGSSPFHTFEMTAQAGKLEVQVLICIEALRERHRGRSIPSPGLS